MKRLKITLLSIILLIICHELAQAGTSDSFSSLYGKGWSAHIGFGSSRLNNIVGLSREFPLDGNWRLHLGCGIGEILVGGGVALYQNPDREGLVGSFNAGLVGAHANFGYLFEVGSRSNLFLGAGLGSGVSFIGKSTGNLYPIVSYEYHFKDLININ